MKIKKRDVAFFLLGILTIFIIDSIMNWEGVKKSFKDGYNEGRGNFENVELKTK